MPRLRREEQTEAPGIRAPALELAPLDRDARVAGTVTNGDLRHLGARLERHDLESALGEQRRRLAGTRADLERPIARLGAREREHVLDELGRIARADAVVELGHVPEGEASFAGRRAGQAAVSAPARAITSSGESVYSLATSERILSIVRAAGATPGPDMVAATTLRAGLRGESSLTTIPGWTCVSASRGISATPTPAATSPCTVS